MVGFDSTDRISRDALLIEIARLFSLRATCGRLKVGAVFAKDGRVICTSYNGVPKGETHCNPELCDLEKSCTRANHAERNAIDYCARHGISLKGSTMYITHNPCIICAKSLVNVGIERVVYDQPFRTSEGIEFLQRHGVIIDKYQEDGI